MTDRISRTALAFILCFSAGASVILADGPDMENSAYHDRLAKKNLRELSGDRPEAKVDAAIYFGARGDLRYLRPLGRELLRNLDKDSPYLRGAGSDPYVKSHLAEAIGRIGDPDGLDYLLRALKHTIDIVEMELQQSAELRKREQAFAESVYGKKGQGKEGGDENLGMYKKPMPKIVLDRNRSGPARMSQGYAIPYSPDVYWSISDEFKDLMSVDETDPYQRMRLKGYNYVNLTVHLLSALDRIYSRMDVKTREDLMSEQAPQIQGLLTYRIPDIRGAAVITLSYMFRGVTDKKIQDPINERLKKEEDPAVRVRVAQGVLIMDRGRRDAIYVLMNLLKDEDAMVRYYAALAFRDLHIGEALFALRKAYQMEEREQIRRILKQAIHNAYIDHYSPVSNDIR